MFYAPALSLSSTAYVSKSIGQSQRGLPDFRTVSVMARILVAVNAAGLAAAAVRSDRMADIPERFTRIAVTLEPALFCALSVLYILSALLARVPYAAGLA